MPEPGSTTEISQTNNRNHNRHDEYMDWYYDGDYDYNSEQQHENDDGEYQYLLEILQKIDLLDSVERQELASDIPQIYGNEDADNLEIKKRIWEKITQDEFADVREMAVRNLYLHGDEGDNLSLWKLGLLNSLIDDGERDVRYRVADKLADFLLNEGAIKGQVYSEVCTMALTVLDDEDKTVRQQLSRYMPSLSEKLNSNVEDKARLIEKAINDAEPDIRRLAVIRMGVIKETDPEFLIQKKIEIMRTVMDDSEILVREAAHSMLPPFLEKDSPETFSKKIDLWKKAVYDKDALSMSGASDRIIDDQETLTPKVLRAKKTIWNEANKADNMQLVYQLTSRLSKIHSIDTPEILVLKRDLVYESLRHSDERVRKKAISNLQVLRSDDTRYVSVVKTGIWESVLNDDNPEVMALAINTLSNNMLWDGYSGEDTVKNNINIYKKILGTKKYFPEVVQIIKRLNIVDDEDLSSGVIGYIEMTLQHGDSEARYEIAHNLAEIKDDDKNTDKKIEIWRRLLNDQDPRVAHRAFLRLEKIKKNKLSGSVFNFYNEILDLHLRADSPSHILSALSASMPEITGNEDAEIMNYKLSVWQRLLAIIPENPGAVSSSIEGKLPIFLESDKPESLDVKYRLLVELATSHPAIASLVASNMPVFLGDQTDLLFSKKIQLYKFFLDEVSDVSLHRKLIVDFKYIKHLSNEQQDTIFSFYDQLSNTKDDDLLAKLLSGFPGFSEFDTDEAYQKKIKTFSKIIENINPRFLGHASTKVPKIFDKDNDETVIQKRDLFSYVYNNSERSAKNNLVSLAPSITGNESKKNLEAKHKIWSILLSEKSSYILDSLLEKFPRLNPEDPIDTYKNKLHIYKMAITQASSYAYENFRMSLLFMVPTSGSNMDREKINLSHKLLYASLADTGSEIYRYCARKIDQDESLDTVRDINSLRELFDVPQGSSLLDIAGFLQKREELKGYYRAFFLAENREQVPLLEKDDLSKPYSDLMELAIEKRLGIDPLDQNGDDALRTLFDEYKSQIPSWNLADDSVADLNGFIDVFGYKKTLTYLKRPNISKESALNAFGSIRRIMELSDMSSDQIWGNLIGQVARDDSKYSGTSSQIYFAILVNSLNYNFEEVKRDAMQYEMEEMVELVNTLSDKKKVFESWGSFKRFAELTELLSNREALISIDNLSKEKPLLSRYIRTLLFHPDSKVRASEVMMFLNQTSDFLSGGDTHALNIVQDRKKPSNYFKIPNLDSTPTDLRDALVEGVLDNIQGFPPFKQGYRIPKDLISSEIISMSEDEVLKLVRDKLRGGRESKEARSMFQELSGIIGKANVKAFSEGTFIPNKNQIQLIRNKYEEKQVTGDYLDIEVEIHPKSSPVAAIAGDDMANCMKFGNGKNTVYMFNTNTSVMTVRLKVGNKWRTIASSLLTKDTEVGDSPIWKEKSYFTGHEFVTEVTRKNGRIDLVLPETVLNVESKSIPVCDNLEMADAYKQKKWQLLTKTLYSDFWLLYLKENSNRFADDKYIRVGLEQDDLGGHYDGTIKNRWIPMAMVSYTDALGDRTGTIDLKDSLKRFRTKTEKTVIKKKENTPITELGKRNGVRYASPDDSLAIGWLESRIYNESGAGQFVEGAHMMENMLIATKINNEQKGRPDLSLVHESVIEGRKKVDGYLMAYEGKLHSGSPDYRGKPVIYVEDMAVIEEAKIGGGAMLLEFLDLYKVNYLEKGNLVPVFMQARESTSFELVMRKLRKIADKLNIDIEVVGDDQKSGDKNHRHEILLVPKQRQSPV